MVPPCARLKTGEAMVPSKALVLFRPIWPEAIVPRDRVSGGMMC
jgi:hypothetical protein